MAEKAIYKIDKNIEIANKVYKMTLCGPTDSLSAPGQFVNIQLAGRYLRRPISVCNWGKGWLSIIYKVLGEGTAQMAEMPVGEELDVLCGLGNGFDVHPAAGRRTVLVGGGVGTPPLYALAKALCAQGDAPQVVLGFAAKRDVFLQEKFEALGCKVCVATEDGSAGVQGFVTAPLAGMGYEYYYACGPNAMLRAVYELGEEKGAAGQLSFEERMGCGFGICMGCSCHTKSGARRVCTDGPVFDSAEVVFA